MARVLLVQPHSDIRKKGKGHDQIPLSLICVATSIKNKHKVKIYNRNLNPDNADFLKLLEEYKPEIVGFNSMTSTMLLDIMELGPLVKRDKKIITVVGGVHATVEPESLLDEPYIDYIVRGEGELAFLDFCDTYDKNPKNLKNLKNINKNPLRPFVNLNDLENPDFNLIDIKEYATIWISTSRGCPGDCSFCYSPKMWRINNVPCVRFLSAEKVKEMLTDLIENHKVSEFSIVDDNFTSSKKRCLDICDFLYTKYHGKVIFYPQVRSDFVDEDILKALKKAGCKYIQYGIESGSQRVLDILNKKVSVERQGEAIKLARKLGVFNYDSFMLGIPGETIEDLNLTISFIKKYKPDVVTAFFFNPLPKTPIFEKLVEEGKIKEPKTLKEWALWSDEVMMPSDGKLKHNYSEIPDEILNREIKKLWKYNFYKNKIKKLLWMLKKGKIKKIANNLKILIKSRKFTSNY